ncbi:hypothetical protein C8Q76DRAFT_701401 [Earliella scabrosa]|nr:hypothetical protein C8Q76DRAFT_701401 [Earliella scabrosa]
MRFLSRFESFVEGALVPLIAIYPTVIVIIVSLNRGHCDTQFTYQTQAPAVIGSIRFCDPQSSTSVARSESGHTDED